MRFHTEPSSRPITPAPITPRRFGTSVRSSAPALSMMRLPSNFANGSSIGTEPVAMITLAASSVCLAPSSPVTSTLLPFSSLPVPKNGVTGLPLTPLNSMATPPVNCLTILSLRPMNVAMSTLAFSTVMPWVGRLWASPQNCLDESSSALDGMQPTLRHVPQRLLAILALERVDAGGLQAQLRRADRADVAGRACADDDDVE